MGREHLLILDQHGRKIPRAAAASPAYEGAATGRRMGSWGTSSAGPNTVLAGSLGTLRSRVRQLVRNNPVAESGVESWVANLIGTGLTPRWMVKDQGLKETIQELWADWVTESDAYGLTDFYGQQALASRLHGGSR